MVYRELPRIISDIRFLTENVRHPRGWARDFDSRTRRRTKDNLSRGDGKPRNIPDVWHLYFPSLRFLHRASCTLHKTKKQVRQINPLTLSAMFSLFYTLYSLYFTSKQVPLIWGPLFIPKVPYTLPCSPSWKVAGYFHRSEAWGDLVMIENIFNTLGN